jgi:hypothetical protein
MKSAVDGFSRDDPRSARSGEEKKDVRVVSRWSEAAWQRADHAWCNRSAPGYDVAIKISQQRLASTAPGGKT